MQHPCCIRSWQNLPLSTLWCCQCPDFLRCYKYSGYHIGRFGRVEEGRNALEESELDAPGTVLVSNTTLAAPSGIYWRPPYLRKQHQGVAAMRGR